MTKTNAKIHVLADETLGGIKREYVEVDRKAEVGEKIITVESCKEFEVGELFTVTERNRWYDGTGISVYETGIGLYHHEYHVLEPTDIVHIDDPDGTTQCYELTDRKAEVGEKVIVVDADVRGEEPYDNGNIFEVRKSYMITDAVRTMCDRIVARREYRVLVPAESAEAEEPQPSDLIDVVANLAKEVAELKRENNERDDAIKKILSGMYDKTKRLENEIDTLHKDNRTLGEELARLKEPAKSESIIESAPFVVVIHEGRGEFDVYQRGKRSKIFHGWRLKRILG